MEETASVWSYWESEYYPDNLTGTKEKHTIKILSKREYTKEQVMALPGFNRWIGNEDSKIIKFGIAGG